jgi:hypothetical protein
LNTQRLLTGRYPRATTRGTMNVSVYRNLSAIRFVRCVAPVPGTPINAGGAAITLKDALTKCESEVVERGFELRELRPMGIIPIGIAAHFNPEDARQRAQHEAIETLCLKQVLDEGVFRCLFCLSISNFSIGVARTKNGYFSVIRGKFSGKMVGTTSASSNLFSTLIKAWEEYRSIYFFKPTGEILRKFTKVNYTFSEDSLQNIRFKLQPLFKYSPQLSALEAKYATRGDRQIVYYVRTKKDENQK